MKKIAIKGRLSIRQILLIAVTVLALIVVGLTIGKPYHSPIPWSRTWNSLVGYTDSHTGASIVMDDGRQRISILDANGKLSGQIEGTVNGSQLNPGLMIHTNGTSAYIVNAVSSSDATAIEREEILQFDMEGNYVGTVAKKTWKDGVHSSYTIADFYFTQDDFSSDNNLRVYTMEDDHFDLCTVNAEKEITPIKTVTIPGKKIFRCNYAFDQGVLAVVTISGDVYTYDGTTLQNVYTYDGAHLFNYAAVGSDGVVYASDYNDSEIYAIRGTEKPERWFSNVQSEFLTPSGNCIVFADANSNTLRKMDLTTRTVERSAGVTYAPKFILYYAVVSAAYLWLVGCIVFWIVRWAVRRRKAPKEPKAPQAGGSFTRGRAIAFMFIAAVIVIGSFITYYTAENRSRAGTDIARASTVFSNNFKGKYGDTLSRINSPADFSGEDYQNIEDYLKNFWQVNLGYGFNSYYFLTRVQGDDIYVITDSNGQFQPGTRYGKMSDTEEGKAILRGETNTGTASDSWGSYTYAESPLYNQKGTVVGVIEIGEYNTTLDRQQLSDAVTIILMVLTILMGAIILIGELFEFRVAIEGMKSEKKAERILALYRPLCFFFFLCTAIDYGYQTIIVKSLLTANGFAENSFLHPLLLSVLCMGFLVGGPIGTWLSSRFPAKRILCVILAAFVADSLLISFVLFVNSLWFYVLLMFVFNTFYGAVYAVLRFFPTLSDDKERRFELYGANEVTNATATILATAMGGYIAQFLGYSMLYIVVAFSCATTAGIAFFGIEDVGILAPAGAAAKKKEAKLSPSKILKFLFTPKGALPILLSMAMLNVAKGYKTYYFPLYSQSLGYDLTAIANVTVIVGSLSALLENRIGNTVGTFGKKRSYLVILLLLAGAMVFAVFNPAYLWPVVFITISQISLNVCKPYENIFFLERAKSGEIPEAQAVNMQIIWENIIRTLTPMIFGVIMIDGYTTANLIMAIALAVSAVVFYLLAGRRKEEKMV